MGAFNTFSKIFSENFFFSSYFLFSKTTRIKKNQPNQTLKPFFFFFKYKLFLGRQKRRVKLNMSINPKSKKNLFGMWFFFLTKWFFSSPRKAKKTARIRGFKKKAPIKGSFFPPPLTFQRKKTHRLPKRKQLDYLKPV